MYIVHHITSTRVRWSRGASSCALRIMHNLCTYMHIIYTYKICTSDLFNITSTMARWSRGASGCALHMINILCTDMYIIYTYNIYILYILHYFNNGAVVEGREQLCSTHNKYFVYLHVHNIYIWYIHIYIYMCTYIHICMHTYIYVYIHYICVCACVRMRVYVCVCGVVVEGRERLCSTRDKYLMYIHVHTIYMKYMHHTSFTWLHKWRSSRAAWAAVPFTQ